MSNLNDLNFNAQNEEPAGFDVLPAGEYDVVITNSEVKPTSTGGKMLKLQLQVMNGQYQNRLLFDNLNLWNNSQKAVQIARGTLSAICRAVNILTPQDSSELHGKPLRVKVVIEKSDEYGEQNRVKAYKPREAGPAFTLAAQQPPAANGAAPAASATTGRPW